MFDQLTSFLFTAGLPRQPESNPDLSSQALELLDCLDRLRTAWDGIMLRLQEEGYEAGEFASACRVQLNLLDNCAVLLEQLLVGSPDLPKLPLEKLGKAEGQIKSLQDEIRPLYELATRKPPSFDPAKLLAAQGSYAGKPAVEIGELIRQIQNGEIEL